MSAGNLTEREIKLGGPGLAASLTDAKYQTLSFRHRGAFATLTAPSTSANGPKRSCLEYHRPHGVLYYIEKQSLSDVAKLETGYGLAEVEVKLYKSEKVVAVAFVSKPSLMLAQPLPPTQRYLDLMISGACEHDLCPKYIAFLRSLDRHEGLALGNEYFATPSVLYANIAIGLLSITSLYIFLRK